MLDLSRIDKLLLLENHNFAVGFSEGYVFLRVLMRELVEVYYDPNQEQTSSNLVSIPARTFRTKQLFGSTDLNTPNILDVSKEFHTYQVFMGIQPSYTRVFLSYEQVDQRALDEGFWGTQSDYRFGYIDGGKSPFKAPGPAGEFILTPDIGVLFSVHNPMPFTISPTFSFLVNRMKVAVMKDANVIFKILQGLIPARPIPLGGLEPPKYNMAKKWMVKPVNFDATFEEVKKAVV